MFVAVADVGELTGDVIREVVLLNEDDGVTENELDVDKNEGDDKDDDDEALSNSARCIIMQRKQSKTPSIVNLLEDVSVSFNTFNGRTSSLIRKKNSLKKTPIFFVNKVKNMFP